MQRARPSARRRFLATLASPFRPTFRAQAGLMRNFSSSLALPPRGQTLLDGSTFKGSLTRDKPAELRRFPPRLLWLRA